MDPKYLSKKIISLKSAILKLQKNDEIREKLVESYQKYNGDLKN